MSANKIRPSSIPSPRERHYWVVSPNVKNNPKTVDEWKKASVREHAAFMGWDPKSQEHLTGPKFAGLTKEGIKPDDVILIARRHHGEPEIVGFGIVYDKRATTKLKGFKPPGNEDFGSLRKLLPFKRCSEPPRGIPLIDVLPHNQALVQLHPEKCDAHKKVRDWLDQHLGKQRVSTRSKDKRKLGLKSAVTVDPPENHQLDYKVQTKSKVEGCLSEVVSPTAH